MPVFLYFGLASVFMLLFLRVFFLSLIGINFFCYFNLLARDMFIN